MGIYNKFRIKLSQVTSEVYWIRSRIWKFQGIIDAKLTRFRFRNRKNKRIPFYDKEKDVYRVFFDDRYDESGSISYVVGEYIKDGLIYHFHRNGEWIYDGEAYRYKITGEDFIDHEHSFEGVLSVIQETNGVGFSIEGFEYEYSAQELRIIIKYVAQLRKDSRSSKKH